MVWLLIMVLGTSCASRSLKADKMTIPNSKSITAKFEQQNKDDSSRFIDIYHRLLKELPYPQQVLKFYKDQEYRPVLLERFFENGQVNEFINYLDQADLHGLNLNLFPTARIKKLLHHFENDLQKRTESNTYELELLIAANLIKYSKTLQFGAIIPSKIYEHYDVPTLSPDSNFIINLFNTANLKRHLDSIQPQYKNYQSLQKALNDNKLDTTDRKETNRKALIVNLERLRWKNRPVVAQKYIIVNIANFSLSVMDKEKPLLQMKVCVGEPGDWATPQLGSIIHSVQVNPVWNIPQSIAKQEIIRLATQDRYYLANSKINVYQNGKLVNSPESIDWSSGDLDKYTFQQQPGVKNALGKIKFLFTNQSAVYLHDTPEQTAFDREIRAVSHGCVRIEKPLELAYLLFGKSEKYQQIKNAMKNGKPQAKFISLYPQVPIRLLYYTAWADEAGNIQFINDIYSLDNDLYLALQKSSLVQ